LFQQRVGIEFEVSEFEKTIGFYQKNLLNYWIEHLERNIELSFQASDKLLNACTSCRMNFS
jgi:hypothetical protein